MHFVLISTHYSIIAVSVSISLIYILLAVNYKISVVQYNQAMCLVVKAYLGLNRSKPTTRFSVVTAQMYLERYYRFHTHCLLNTIEINKIFGGILLFMIVINTPSNAFLVMSLIHIPLSPLHFLFIVLAIIYQLVAILGLHLIAINYSKQIHSTSKILMKVNVCPQYNTMSTTSKLKLCNYIYKIHTKSRYGITYGAIRLVTFATFFRVSFTISTYWN